MTIPGRRPEGLRTPTSDPVSPNTPWHPELDRRHSDSANMTNFAHQNSEIENVEIAKETEIDTKTTECPTYQNTSLMSGIIFYIYVSFMSYSTSVELRNCVELYLLLNTLHYCFGKISS